LTRTLLTTKQTQ